MARQDKPADRDERRAVRETERELSGATYQCPDCSASYGTPALLGVHVLLAHGEGR